MNLKGFFRWLFNLKPEHFTGLLPDTRTQEEKERDFSHSERAVEAPANPFGNAKLLSSPYPYVDQLQTNSCVPHAVTLALAIERKADANNFATLAPMFPYRLRSVYPKAGAVPQNIFDLLKKYGAPLFSTLPNVSTDELANALVLTQQHYTEAAIYKGLTYWKIDKPNDITVLAQVAQLGHGVPITLFATYDEWARQYPVINNPKLQYSQAEVQHEVCILPYSSFIENGVKYVAIQDSAFFGGWELRYLSEDFIRNRVYAAHYWDKVATIGNGTKPHYTFTRTLTVGSKGEDVKALQQLLIAEGLLPNGCATGYFAGRTLAGVKAFQAKYAMDILIPSQITAPTGFVGNATLKKLNQLCG